jgi:uridine phosphorylase
LRGKRFDQASVFTPDSLLREARRQRGLASHPVPEVCVLDPDGDLARQLQATGRTILDPHWACYHTSLHRVAGGDRELGIVPFAVGASFAVLVAEELFACGCRLLISMSSAGQVAPRGPPPYFVLIERALRDEGTSYHYVPPADFSHADSGLLEKLGGAFDDLRVPVHRGGVWTTDAPFRETASAVSAMKAMGLLAVEMEAAALYALAQASQYAVLCFAHVTNQMGAVEGDFEKGEADGTVDALAVIQRTVERLRLAYRTVDSGKA